MFQIVSLAVIATLVLIDRLTKVAVIEFVDSVGPKEFLFGSFRITYVENTGAAFSSFSNNTTLLTAVTSVIVVGCLVYLLMKKAPNIFVNITLMLIISGGIGNIIDRIKNGYVVDFIEPLFMNFAVFNFADCCITVGAFALAGYEIVTAFKNKDKGDSDG